jgi:hypothetical protein
VSTPALSAWRLTLGPSNAGGDYAVLAASDGLDIRGAAQETFLRLHFALMQLKLGRPVHGLLRLDEGPEAPWMLFSSAKVGAGERGDLWVTEAALIRDETFYALSGLVHPLLARLKPGSPPPLGTRLDALSLDHLKPRPASSAAASLAGLLIQYAVGVETRADAVDQFLFDLLTAVPPETRRNLSFFSGPPVIQGPVMQPTRGPDLSVWAEGEGVRRLTVPILVVQAHDPNHPNVPPEAKVSVSWWALVQRLSALDPALGRMLEPEARKAVAKPESHAVVAGLGAYLDRLGQAQKAPAARAQGFESLVCAAASVESDQPRLELGAMMSDVWREETNRADHPVQWINIAVRRQAELCRLGAKPGFAADLALETKAMLALDEAAASVVGPHLTGSRAERATKLMLADGGKTVAGLPALLTHLARSGAPGKDAASLQLAIELSDVAANMEHGEGRETVLEILSQNWAQSYRVIAEFKRRGVFSALSLEPTRLRFRSGLAQWRRDAARALRDARTPSARCVAFAKAIKLCGIDDVRGR